MNDMRAGGAVAPKQQSTAELINSNLNEIVDRTSGMVTRLEDMETLIYGDR